MKRKHKLRRLSCIIVIINLLFALCGCWDYRGLNQLTIVAGMALDYENNQYKTTFEIVDLTKPVKEKGLTTILLNSEGETIFDAIRNAKRKIKSRLYFAHMMTVIISEDIAKKGDINRIVDWFLRDSEGRETMYLVISQENTAAEILKAENVESAALSYEIENILDNDNKLTLSTNAQKLYQIYSYLNSTGKTLTLPAIKLVNDDKTRLEINGTAVFKDKTFLGYLSPDESKFLLFILDEVKGGVLTVEAPDNSSSKLTLEISKNKTSKNFTISEGHITIEIKTNTDVFLGESNGNINSFDKTSINEISETAQRQLEMGIQELVKKVQKDYKSDIFGFGDLVRQKDQTLWAQLKDNWQEELQKITVRVTPKIEIENTALLKK